MRFSLRELAAIRGAMWSARWSGPALPPYSMGPRPYQPTNILAMDYYEWYPPELRAQMRAIYKLRNYRHAVTGPLVDGGYRPGMYPPQLTVPTQAQFNHYLDCMQEWWDDGIAPIHFMHPDGWTFEQTRDQLTALYSQPRAKRLLRILVPTGWEPTRYDWSSYTWAMFGRWARDINPEALILLHTVSDADCPVGKDNHGDDTPDIPNWGRVWARIVPNIHGWLIQNGPY
jgi:hypothetical protein